MSIYNLDPENFAPPTPSPVSEINILVTRYEEQESSIYAITERMLNQLTLQMRDDKGAFTLVDGDRFLYFSRYGVSSIERVP